MNSALLYIILMGKTVTKLRVIFSEIEKLNILDMKETKYFIQKGLGGKNIRWAVKWIAVLSKHKENKMQICVLQTYQSRDFFTVCISVKYQRFVHNG